MLISSIIVLRDKPEFKRVMIPTKIQIPDSGQAYLFFAYMHDCRDPILHNINSGFSWKLRLRGGRLIILGYLENTNLQIVTLGAVRPSQYYA